MAYDIGPKIGIDGEAEFRKQLREINESMKTLGTEAKVLAAEFEGQEGSMEALGAQSDLLQRQIYTLTDRLELQSRMLGEAAGAFGEADTKTQQWQQAVNATQAELTRLQAQLDKNITAMAQNTDATGKLTAEIDKQEQELQELQRAYSNAVLEEGKNSEQARNLQDRIRSLNGELETNRTRLKDAGDAMETTQDKGGKLSDFFSGTMEVAVGNLVSNGFDLLVDAAKQAAEELGKVVTESAAFADEILTLSAQTGLSTETLQEFSYMADLVDVPVNTLQGSLTKLTKTMDSYRSGNKSAREAFEKLGLSMDTVVGPDGQLRRAEDVWYVVIDALSKIQNQTERDAISMAIFGRSAQDLNPIINLGSSGIKKYADEAHNMSAVLSNEQLDALGDVDDAFRRLEQQQDTIKRQIAAELAPELLELVKAFTVLARSVDWQALADGITPVIEGLTELIKTVQTAVEWWNQLTNASSGGPQMSAAAAMWDGGHSVAAKSSVPNYTTSAYTSAATAQTDAINRLASSQAQPVNWTIKFNGSDAQLARALDPSISAERGRQGRSLTGR